MAAELLLTGFWNIPTLRRFRKEHERLRVAPPESGEPQDPFERQLARTSAALGREPADVKQRVQRFMIDRPGKWLRLFRREELLREIRAFRSGGGKTALVSDYPARRKLAALDAAALFDACVASGEPEGPGELKPSPEGYLRAAKLLGVDPRKCLVIGDRPDADGEAARAAGMHFRHVRNRRIVCGPPLRVLSSPRVEIAFATSGSRGRRIAVGVGRCDRVEDRSPLPRHRERSRLRPGEGDERGLYRAFRALLRRSEEQVRRREPGSQPVRVPSLDQDGRPSTADAPLLQPKARSTKVRVHPRLVRRRLLGRKASKAPRSGRERVSKPRMSNRSVRLGAA